MTPTDLAVPTSDQEVSLSIGGMTCGACVARIERRLNSLDGVEAQVNLASERARVRLPPGTSPAIVIERIESAGFTAEIVDDLAARSATLRAQPRRTAGSATSDGGWWWPGLLFMPLGDASIAFWLVPSLRFSGWQWILLALAAPILTWAAWPFYKAAIRNGAAWGRHDGHLGVTRDRGCHGWSIYAMFFRDTSHVARTFRYVLAHQSGGAIYLDVAAGVTTFLLAGRYFEARSRAPQRQCAPCALRGRRQRRRGARRHGTLNGAARSQHSHGGSIRRPTRRDRRHRRRGHLRAIGPRPQRHDRRVGAGRRDRR